MIPAISANLYKRQQTNNNAFSSACQIRSNSNKNQNNSNRLPNNTNINNAYIAPKETELSTKNTSKDNYLDYTFISHRSQISNQKSRDVTKSKDYIFDLTNTWELNIDLIENLLKEHKSSGGFNDLSEILQSIKQKFEKKKQLREEVCKVRGKILIEKQIIEELKRKCDENEDYYKDQIKEFEENRDNKEEYIKIFEKKLKEVEIYVQKNSKNTNSKFEMYKDFKISDFIEENTLLVKKRDDLTKELHEAQAQKMEVENENANYRHEMNNFSFENPDDESGVRMSSRTGNNLNEKSKMKLRQYYDFCRNQVRVLEMRNKLLRNYFKEMSSKLKYFNMDECKS